MKIGHAACRILPWPAVRWIGHFGGWIAWQLAPRKRKVALRTMARVTNGAPEKIDNRCRFLARELFAYYGRYWAELLWLRAPRLDTVVKNISVEGLENIGEALRHQNGVILLLPHMGNWEVFGPVVAAEGARLVAVAENLADRELTDWFCAHRSSLGIDVVVADDSLALGRSLLEALSQNAVVALLNDRKVTGAGVQVNFFGEVTEIPSGFAALTKRTGAAVIPCVVTYDRENGHHAKIAAPLELDTEDVQSCVQKVVGEFEAFIQESPSQWHILTPNWPSDRAEA